MAGFYEFFAGGGMARLGLGRGWECLFANDFDAAKTAAYRANFAPAEELREGDVAALTAEDLPGAADLAWASFPCQDLSLAGAGAGLGGGRSGTFWTFMRLVEALRAQGRAPRAIALENVVGALSSRGGADFAAIGGALADAGYVFGAMVVDAALFVPQSRPRLFVVALRDDVAADPSLAADGPDPLWHPPALLKAHAALLAMRPALADRWRRWRLPPPPMRRASVRDIVEDDPQGVRWHDERTTARLLSLMAPLHRAKVEAAQRAGGRRVGAVYRRTRTTAEGTKAQRAEVRFDDVAGCLRTPAGGSSRQTLLIVEGARVRSRLLSGREAARLMGLPDSYRLPARYTDAYHLAGDGVAPPVVRHLARRLIEPLLGLKAARRAAA